MHCALVVPYIDLCFSLKVKSQTQYGAVGNVYLLVVLKLDTQLMRAECYRCAGRGEKLHLHGPMCGPLSVLERCCVR